MRSIFPDGPEKMNTLEKLQRWYMDHCQGEWEHHEGISIQSCDNPGWWVKINLQGTRLRDQSFAALSKNVSSDGHQTESAWISCYVKDNVWNGAGDATKLEEILQVFLEWSEHSY